MLSLLNTMYKVVESENGCVGCPATPNSYSLLTMFGPQLDLEPAIQSETIIIKIDMKGRAPPFSQLHLSSFGAYDCEHLVQLIIVFTSGWLRLAPNDWRANGASSKCCCLRHASNPLAIGPLTNKSYNLEVKVCFGGYI